MNRKAFLILPLVLLGLAVLLFFTVFQRQSAQNDFQKLYEKVDGSISPERIQQHGRVLSSSPHRAGSPANRKAGDEILTALSSYGYKTSVEEHTFDFPEVQEAQLSLILPEQIQFDLREKVFPEDAFSAAAANEIPFFAFSPDTNIDGRLIYANYGSKEDYDYLKHQGIDVSNTIALVRARGICRSMKALVAEQEGVAGLLIYPELKDQGVLKPEFPFGSHLNLWTSQRGTLLKYFLYPGDPSEPEAQSVLTLPRIPALPISQQTASVLLKHIQGELAPELWKGWLPEGYRIGPGPGTVKMVYRSKMERRTIRNIFASLQGADDESHFLIAGNHYDAWVYGASDPSSGTAVLLETAKALSDLARDGWNPQRRILFSFWDGEEYGMYGSTAWVRKNLSLLKKAVAYVNVDSAYRARDLAAYVSPGLHSSFDHSLVGLMDPDSGRLFSEIRPEFQNPGFSSDAAPFLRFAGLPVVEAGFGRTYGVYHSVYDNGMWLEKFGDPGARFRSSLAQIFSRYLIRLSSEPLIPFDFTEIQPYAKQALEGLKDQKWSGHTEALHREMELFQAVAVRINKIREQKSKLSGEPLSAMNNLLLNAVQAFHDGSRSSIMETSSVLGCASEALPEASDAYRSKDEEKFRTAMVRLTKAFSKSRGHLEAALRLP